MGRGLLTGALRLQIRAQFVCLKQSWCLNCWKFSVQKLLSPLSWGVSSIRICREGVLYTIEVSLCWLVSPSAWASRFINSYLWDFWQELNWTTRQSKSDPGRYNIWGLYFHLSPRKERERNRYFISSDDVNRLMFRRCWRYLSAKESEQGWMVVTGKVCGVTSNDRYLAVLVDNFNFLGGDELCEIRCSK